MGYRADGVCMMGCAEVNARVYCRQLRWHRTNFNVKARTSSVFRSEPQSSYAIHASRSTVQIFNTNPHHTWPRSSTSTTTAPPSQPTADPIHHANSGSIAADPIFPTPTAQFSASSRPLQCSQYPTNHIAQRRRVAFQITTNPF